ncbi:MAG TPA: carboxylesterase/lipase family protein [Candidatus Saccharimonadales bacterium]|jgi:para-nitrobenzyl esterase|nr:carboxylesterase/lipase family protein [Candidatus Saccharimonadales bacterium]
MYRKTNGQPREYVPSTTFNRRALLKSSMISGGAAVAGILFRGFMPGLAYGVDTSSKYEGPIVETVSGKVRGIVLGGTHIFRGIPYGASTAGSNRFMPPRKPEPWTGVREAYQNGSTAPQLSGPPQPLILNHKEPAVQGEDCLVMNIFTPSLKDTRKRPVMVWLHGGGFASGAGSAHSFDGTNLAASQDVVVVSVNHRLNIFGYLYLADVGGEKYADSGNAGLLDVIAVLEWVRDNISHFGGNPGNVTLFGQSGGGLKISTLLAMPAAKGLYHKAIIESGALLQGVHREDANKTTQRILTKLGMQPNQVDDLQKLPADRLLSTIDNRGAAPGTAPIVLAPVVDGRALPRDPFDPAAPEISAEVPLIIGTVNTEGTFFTPPDSPLYSLDDAGLKSRLSARYGDSTDALIDLYRKEMPSASASEVYFMINAFPAAAITQAERKAAQGKAPVFMYLFTWETPVEGGKRHSPHTVELPFVFNNVVEQPEEVGNGPELQPLADKVSGAWATFARTGTPNTPGTPKWLPYSENDRATMIINNDWKLVNDPRHEVRLIMNSLPAPKNS